MIRFPLALLLLASPVFAQQAAEGSGGVVRWLDRLTGEIADLDLSRGQSVEKGRLTIRLDECRYPVADPASNAYAHLTILDKLKPEPVFSGWMIASTPALSALDHPRYDVWILHCDTE
jgi:hypothetical protein